MRAVIQRVSTARVLVEEETVGEIGAGLLILLGVGLSDTEEDVKYMARKTVNLRLFEDDEGKMNRSLLDKRGEALVVPQFTLYGDCRKGRRPSFSTAAPPELGETLYRQYTEALKAHGVRVATGKFRAHMRVELTNDGPVTVLLDSSRLF